MGASVSKLLQNPAVAALAQQALPALAGLTGGCVLPAAANQAAPCGSSSSSSSRSLAVRVREAQSERGAFRRVVLIEADAEMSTQAPDLTFQQVEERICAKFKSTRGSDGLEVGQRRLIALVRIKDSLEVADDEDAGLLQEGDELEATFTAL